MAPVVSSMVAARRRLIRVVRPTNKPPRLNRAANQGVQVRVMLKLITFLALSTATFGRTTLDVFPVAKVGHLTQVGASTFVDLTKVKVIKAMILINLPKGPRILSLTEDGVKEALSIVKNEALPTADSEHGGISVSISLDDLRLTPFSASTETDRANPEAIASGLSKSLTLFTEIIKHVQ